MVTKFYQHILALAFAVHEINQNSKLLPNVTLGFHICDTYSNERMTYRTTLDLLYKLRKYFPNYECVHQKKIMAVIGGLGCDLSFQMANILGLFKIPQLTYGPFTREANDMIQQSPSFYSMVPNENQQYMGIIRLLQHFGWTWVGLFVVNDNSGEHFLQVLELLLSQNGICLAFAERIISQAHWNMHQDAQDLISNVFQPFADSKAKTSILYGESRTIIALMTLIALGDFEWKENESLRKVWITTAQVDFAMTTIQWGWNYEFFHGALSFTIHTKELPGFRKFLQDIKPDWTKQDSFVKEFWEQAFVCSFPNSSDHTDAYKACTGEENLESLPGPVFEMHILGHSYSIYNAVYAIAHALHAICVSQFKHREPVDGKRVDLQDIQPWQEAPGFQKFLQDIKPAWTKHGSFFEAFWEQAFGCSFLNSSDHMSTYETCTGEERLEGLPGPVFEMCMLGHSYHNYNAAYTIGHALHATYISQYKQRALVDGKRVDLQDVQPWQLHSFLQHLLFNNSAGETVSFNEKMEMWTGFDITNLVTFPNRSFQRVKVGKVNSNALEGKDFIIQEDLIVWQKSFNQVVPLSVCNDYCLPGYQKKKKEGQKFCCYDCILCPEGEISSQKDLDECTQCPEDKYPSKNHDQCIPKMISFLSAEEPLGISLASIAVAFSLFTVLVLGTFIKHRDTPIVKTSNQNITFILLISLLLCFLCSLLFLGRPRMVTCFLQQPVFGIIFTVAVSCILAKTITVVIAFMATRPGSKMRKWVGKRLTNCIVLSCSLIQMCICVVWLGTTPPFPAVDTKSMTEQIIIECNEGSAIMFDVVLGYLGLLSLISLAVAFLARKLPDSFNEAKFITFSMLIFCSVWGSFVPTYLSTKGKYMVAVEIFSILASSVGLLACIFSPKCYIILLRPELNKKKQLIWRKKEIVL